MDWWDDQAEKLKQIIKMEERQIGSSYRDDEIRRSAVHSREDLIMVVSLLSSLNKTVDAIKGLLWWIMFLLGLVVSHTLWK